MEIEPRSLAVSKSNGVEVLRNLLGFGAGEMIDAIFVAIDFEGCQNIENAFQTSIDSEFGVAYLDTRDLLHHEEKDPSSFITTQEFATGSNSRFDKAVKNFRFGVAERVSIYDLGEKIRQCLNPQDADITNEKRKVIIVRHWRNEMRSVEALRIFSHDLRCVHRILDISRTANELFERPPGCPIGLTKLSSDLSLPFRGEDFHTAGNDANCTLRVLLMLAVKSQENIIPEGPQSKLVALLRQIAQAPLPPTKSEEEVNRLLAMQPTEPLDDAAQPVDMSRFYVKLTKASLRQRFTQRRQEKDNDPEERARRAAIRANRDLKEDGENFMGALQQLEIRVSNAAS
ncbi:uncharacterized protein LY89DRAFT_293389 [Mollisia scopiformis]|uniref:Gfd2/YDR514C-like C-terminal domain-containing protein n=1 Tax=Mollisia scopiformis TaxID=149040 RepID=A0A194XQH9_MOLSC|nr:uncharacterized protein LY89DRAFT_293389 [Mollisia scopiformis]KUJ22314.1 hypothetical protein LY89DRAFT_293389 [Mollisia scopiformis]